MDGGIDGDSNLGGYGVGEVLAGLCQVL